MKKCFPFFNACGSQLEAVEMRHCSLLSVPDEVLRNTRSIEECYLDANQIKDLPKNFFRLSRVKIITLSDNELTYIPEGVGNFVQLMELDVSRNRIGTLHHNIRYCGDLRILDLSNNPINRLPEGFSSLRNLKFLNVNDISLTDLPNDFGNLTALEKLELRDNCLRELPNSFAKLQNLEFLDIGGNEFQEFPKPLGKLRNLKVLCIENNELQIIPQDIGALRNLQELDMSENFLTEISDEIGNLTSLTDLVLSQNSLDALPNTIGNLKELTVLKVDQNKLMTLTSLIGDCSKLQELYLTENFLQRLPGTLGKLSQLVHLKVDQNQLTGIPSELIKCNQLTIMSFRGNRIRKIPNDIGCMSNLHVLDVSNNLLDKLPVSIAECPLKALWLSENQSQSLVKLQRDIDPDTKEEFLTCYLLPQSGIEDLDVNNMEVVEAVRTLPPDFREQTGVDESRPESVAARISGDYSQQVNHTEPGDADGAQSDVKVRFHDDEHVPSNRISKEILPKTRHPKLDKKAIDGHIIPKEMNANKDTKFAPNRFSGNGDHLDSRMTKSAQYRTKKTSAPPSMAPNPNSFRLTNNGEYTNTNLQSVTESGSDQGIVKRSHSDAGLPPSGENNGEFVGDNSSEGSMRCKDDVDNNTDSLQKQNKSKQTVTMNDKVNEITRNSKENTPCNAYQDHTRYSSGGEEIDGFDRHVGFSNDVDDNEENTNLRLIRRDTPHYTKKARIHEVSADGTKNEDVVKQIMEKLKHSPSPLSTNSEVTGMNHHLDQTPVQLRTQTSSSAAPTYDQVVAASALARGSNVPPGLQSATKSTEELTIRITRSHNEQLGMSIAGGVGSTPHQPVFISRLTDTGAAHKFGLMVNDRILSVNGRTFVNIKHDDAAIILKNAGLSFEIIVQRDFVIAPPPLNHQASSGNVAQLGSLSSDPSSPSGQNVPFSQDQNQDDVDVTFQTITADVIRDENGLGFSIAGGKGSMRRDLCDQRWAFLESIYICKITPNGAADRCKMLQVGDKIIKINDIDVKDARHDQAVVLLSGTERLIKLEVQRQVIVPRAGSTAPTSDVPDLSEASSDNAHPSHEADSLQTVQQHHYEGHENRETVKIIKTKNQLGLSICGGIDHCSHPFGIDRQGIFISKISTTGAAYACGKLRIGDRILSVNGHDITRATHDEAILHFVQSGTSEITLEVVHEPPPPGLKKIIIMKDIKEKLGINIQGGNDGSGMNPDDPKDKGIFITKILPDGVVYRDGRLHVGDRLIEVNSRTFMGIPLATANKVLGEVTTQMEVIACDGVTPEKITQALTNCSNNINSHPSELATLGATATSMSPGSVSPVSWKYGSTTPTTKSSSSSSSTTARASLSSPKYLSNPQSNHSSSAQHIISPSSPNHASSVHTNNVQNQVPETEQHADERTHLSFKSKRELFEKNAK